MAKHYKPKICVNCNREYLRPPAARVCQECRYALSAIGGPAQSKVTIAVKLGFLQPAKDFDCVDCGAPAVAYDHRDYDAPVTVEPVCHMCNYKRGPAKLRPERMPWLKSA